MRDVDARRRGPRWSSDVARGETMRLAKSIGVADSRPQERATGNALTVVVPIIAGHEQTLQALLDDIGTHIRENALVPFHELRLVHFMRWVVIPADPPSAALLAFESNYDGSLEAHLAELVGAAGAGVHAIYRHCQGYPVGDDVLAADRGAQVMRYLLDHTLPYRAFYAAVPNASAVQIRGEEAIRQAIEEVLSSDDPSGKGRTLDALALCRAASERVRNDPALRPILEAAEDSMPIRPLRLVTGVLGAAALVPALVPGLLAIGVKERFDRQTDQLAIPDRARQLMAREDLQVQNQLTHVVSLRPGPLRALSTRVVLGAIDFLARELFVRGSLGNISSIHFARWVLIDGGKRLLFFSNYDGSWENYLGDFIDRAAIGLTAVWSNTVDFPKSVLLVGKGATDEERFKAWTRAHQIPTQVWYSAYPTLTVANILNNRKISAQLRRGITREDQAREWLQLL
jgi:hypothetical protein